MYDEKSDLEMRCEMRRRGIPFKDAPKEMDLAGTDIIYNDKEAILKNRSGGNNKKGGSDVTVSVYSFAGSGRLLEIKDAAGKLHFQLEKSGIIILRKLPLWLRQVPAFTCEDFWPNYFEKCPWKVNDFIPHEPEGIPLYLRQRDPIDVLQIVAFIPNEVCEILEVW